MTNNKAVDRSEKMYTTNLNHSISLFNKMAPDLIAFQEIDFDADRSYNRNQMEAIANSIPYPYSAAAVNWDKRYVPFPYWPISQQFGKIVSGQAVLSKFPIVENTIHKLVKPEGNPFYYNAFYLDRLAQITRINIGKNDLILINVHLEAFHAETRDTQIKTVLGIVHQYSEQNPVILCGDFNSTPPGVSNPYQNDHVIQALLADFQLEMAINMDANKNDESAYFTFNSENPDKRIDYFFYNPKFIKFLDARVLTEAEQISDHLPVWMKFVIR
tara:strand:+ start:138788 stop:139603 length:816 start_codon:yes stop_codon:yes gene_type:complete